MTKPAGKLPRSVIAAFLVLLVLAVVVTVVRNGPDTETREAPTSPVRPVEAGPVTEPDVVPDTATRMESGYSGLVVGRMRGTLRQRTRLGALHPIFLGEILSSWQTSWCLQFSIGPAPGEGSDAGRTVRVYHTARLLELIAPPWPESGPPALEPGMCDVIAELAQRLRRLHPDEPGAQLAGALIQTPGFDYTGIARLTNLDPAAFAGGRSAVTAASRILADWEGRPAPGWAVTGAADVEALSPSLVDHLQTLSAPGLAIRVLPPPDVPEGESVQQDGVSLAELAPSALIHDALGDVDLRLTVTWTRTAADPPEDTRQRYTGQGRISVVDRTDAVLANLPAQGTLEIGVDRVGARLLTGLSLTAPLGELLRTRARFDRDEVSWGDDLTLELLYRAEPAP
jgi:hypothetical protein